MTVAGCSGGCCDGNQASRIDVGNACRKRGAGSASARLLGGKYKLGELDMSANAREHDETASLVT